MRWNPIRRHTQQAPSGAAARERGREDRGRDAEAAVFVANLKVAEYQTLRQEITQSLATQQQIIAWSLAAFGAFFAAGLVLAGQSEVDVTSGTVGTLFLLLFGLALPGIAIASCWSWLGELIRMERAGRYLRGFEKEVAMWCQERGIDGAPLRWETHNAAARSARHGVARGKQRVGYFGSLLLYAGALGVSELIFVVAVTSHSWHPDTPAFTDQALYVWSGVTVLLLVGSVTLTIRALQAASREAVQLDQVTPATQTYPLPKPPRGRRGRT
jgi:hypothetical protein